MAIHGGRVRDDNAWSDIINTDHGTGSYESRLSKTKFSFSLFGLTITADWLEREREREIGDGTQCARRG